LEEAFTKTVGNEKHLSANPWRHATTAYTDGYKAEHCWFKVHYSAIV